MPSGRSWRVDDRYLIFRSYIEHRRNDSFDVSSPTDQDAGAEAAVMLLKSLPVLVSMVLRKSEITGLCDTGENDLSMHAVVPILIVGYERKNIDILRLEKQISNMEMEGHTSRESICNALVQGQPRESVETLATSHKCRNSNGN
jgi:hypothetical protein